MLITKEINIILSKRNIKRVIKRYRLNEELKAGDIVKIPVEKLTNKSSIIIQASCDYCQILLNMKYSAYTKRIEVVNKISCSNISCSNKKIKDVCLEKYGVENAFQSEEIKSKSKETNLRKYGVEFASMCVEFKENLKKSNLIKYGVENVLQSEEIRLKSKETNLERYGVENVFKSEYIKDKIKETLIDKYGVDHPLKSEEIKSKLSDTNLKKYGVENVFQSEEIKLKSKETNLEKYGFEHPSQSNEIKLKTKETTINRYGVSSYTKTKEYREKSKETNLKKWGSDHYNKSDRFINSTKIGSDIDYIQCLGNGIYKMFCEKGHEFDIKQLNYHGRNAHNIPLCTICFPIGDQKSIKEKDLLKFISEIYEGEIISGHRDGLEIDIYLPELKIGFEFNGLYFHSNKFKDKNYHIDKTNYFKERDIRIIHIWEDDWTFKREIVESQIKNLLRLNSEKIFARKCLIKKIYVKEARKFLNDNHIQGSVSSSIKIGLYYNDELVSIMIFNNSEGRKMMEKDGWNLSRFCNKLCVNVIGGASKLLNYFIKEYRPKRIISYADKDWSIGDLYYKIGFENIGGNGPDYKYIVSGRRVHKSRYKKSKLNTLLTEARQMKLNEINKVYDCGKIKFERNF